MNFNINQFQAAAAAAAAGNPSNINMNTLMSNLLANSNIDFSQLANFNPVVQPNSSRSNLQQAHHRSSNANLNSNSHLNSIANLQNAENPAAAAGILSSLPSLTNITSSAIADLASLQHVSSLGAGGGGGRTSIQSAHHRSSGSNHHTNHHPSSVSQLTAAHQSTSVGKNLAAHQSQNSVIHHRHSSSASHNAHNSSLNNHHSYNNINNYSNSISSNNTTSSNNINNNNNNTNSTQIIIATNSTNQTTPPKNSTCYRIGDCIYFEASPTLPSQIGRIDEICKTNGDIIEVKVVVFFRRRDISSSLMTLADKYQYDESQEEEIKEMSEKDKNLLKQRELFYSRVIETIPASSIRGKCTVQLLNESESLSSYISKEDHYFYTLVYDPQQKTITADRGEIRVGQRYQAEVQPAPVYTFQPDGDPADPRDLKELETLVYTPDHNLTDDDINKFLTIAKSVGTFARALDCSSSIKQPSLHLTAASASRDVTLLYAMNLLHQNNYDLGKAVCALVPSTGPVLCRDEIEEWTAGEATLFEEAIEKYGREFNDIRQDFLPWKSVKNIVEYYYMWKTTDRSINQRRMKALEAESKVSVLYISDPEGDIKRSPANSTPTPSAENNNLDTVKGRSAKRSQESEEAPLSSNLENSNATQKRRQVSEPKLSAHVACHTTPGENLRFISTKRHKILRREMITRKQLRHLSRRPWERRTKSRA